MHELAEVFAGHVKACRRLESLWSHVMNISLLLFLLCITPGQVSKGLHEHRNTVRGRPGAGDRHIPGDVPGHLVELIGQPDQADAEMSRYLGVVGPEIKVS